MSQRTKPPFRADQVGSLLRSAPVKEARTKLMAGEISAAQLKAVEDAEIRKLVAKQESIGLQAVTDGEFRRSWWHYDFLKHLDGVELVSVSQGLQFKGTETKAEGLHVHGKIDFSASHPMLDHFRFLKSVAKAVPKMTLPSPTALHFRGGRKAIEMSAYPTMEPFFADLGTAYSKAVRAFGEAGCTYLQLDEVFVAYLCDEAQRQMLRDRGDDPDSLLHVYADLVNAACAGRTPGMTISMHLCRGNFRSTWMAQGGYERVADILFNTMNVDAYFMEYDSAQGQAGRAGRDDVQDRRAGEQGPAQAPHRGGVEVHVARPALPLAAMRLRLDGRGQPAGRGGAVGETGALRRGGEGSLGRLDGLHTPCNLACKRRARKPGRIA
jgi:5-methyltetrahydropteroyltriglutamate--homocysteine methyltransferase